MVELTIILLNSLSAFFLAGAIHSAIKEHWLEVLGQSLLLGANIFAVIIATVKYLQG